MNAPLSSAALEWRAYCDPSAATFSYIWMRNKWKSCPLSQGSEPADWWTATGNAFMRTSKDGIRTQFTLFPQAGGHQATNIQINMRPSRVYYTKIFIVTSNKIHITQLVPPAGALKYSLGFTEDKI